MRLPVRNFVAVSAMLVFLAGIGNANAKTKRASSHHPSKHTHHTSASTSGHKRHSGRVKKTSWKRHGQQNIAPERVREIQQALIREKYLDGAPSGKWDGQTQQAMARFQTANGWQSKVTPDSRALIKLGLGPNYSEETLVFEGKTDAVAANANSASSAPNK